MTDPIPYAVNEDGTSMDQKQVAEWLGYGPHVANMNCEHDHIHQAMCDVLGIPSMSLSGIDHELADLEEHAALALQRLIQHLRLYKAW